MNRTIMTMAAVSALAIGTPAVSQTANANLSARIGQLQTEIQTGVRAGTITRNEAAPLREQLRVLRQTELQYGRNGLTRAERQDLQGRIQNLRQQVRYAERTGAGSTYGNNAYGNNPWIDQNRDGYDDRDTDRDGRWDDNVQSGQYGQYGNSQWIDQNRDGYDDRDTDRDGRWDDNVQSGQYGSSGWIDQNRDGFDDRDTDRDGRWDDNVYAGQGGPYEEPVICDSRGGIGGVIDSVFGRDTNCSLRVGQRASGNLYGVPYEYQNRYRDGNGVYYRSDGRQIYQIDARTQTVIRAYPM